MMNKHLEQAAKDITNMFRGIKPPFPLLHPDRAPRIEEAVLSILQKAENAAQDQHLEDLRQHGNPGDPLAPSIIDIFVPMSPVSTVPVVPETAPDPTLPDPVAPSPEQPAQESEAQQQ